VSDSDAPTVRGLQLQPVVPELYGLLYEWFVGQHQLGMRWRFRGATPTPEDFSRTLPVGVYAHYVGVRVKTDEIVSYVVAYRANDRDGYCYVAAAVPDALRLRTGAGMLSLGLLIDFLFASTPYRKVYAEASEHNMPQYASAVGKIFSVEGTLKAHEWFDGRYQDMSILSLTRQHWLDIRSRYGYGQTDAKWR
jgi:hypothetical protein